MPLVECVFPARAGVIPDPGLPSWLAPCIPRACGGDPTGWPDHIGIVEDSPRKRG